VSLSYFIPIGVTAALPGHGWGSNPSLAVPLSTQLIDPCLTWVEDTAGGGHRKPNHIFSVTFFNISRWQNSQAPSTHGASFQSQRPRKHISGQSFRARETRRHAYAGMGTIPGPEIPIHKAARAALRHEKKAVIGHQRAEDRVRWCRRAIVTGVEKATHR
jgi:hypothetical protein